MHSSLLPYSPERDIYRLLGVPSTASDDEVAAAWRRLARTFHPDRNPSGRATAEMQVVNAVRQVMSDPRARAMYDRERRLFHARLAQPIRPARAPWSPAATPRAAAPVPSMAPIAALKRGGPSLAILRYCRAAVAGLRAATLTLMPPRCRGCGAVIASGEDRYCAACGTPLLTGG